jgi:hypothetical protein
MKFQAFAALRRYSMCLDLPSNNYYYYYYYYYSRTVNFQTFTGTLQRKGISNRRIIRAWESGRLRQVYRRSGAVMNKDDLNYWHKASDLTTMEVNRLVVPGCCCSICNANKHVITGPCIVTGIRIHPIPRFDRDLFPSVIKPSIPM